MEDLNGLIDSLGAASIAIAGPRGSGKTALIEAFCSGIYHPDNDAPDLCIQVSAPVQYDAREFILHLYSMTCRAVIEYTRGSTQPNRIYRRAARIAQRQLTIGHLHEPRFAKCLDPGAALADLSLRAAVRLIRVRYLQTFGTEVSGKTSGKLLEFSHKASVSLATQPQTYPEIVADLREFLREVAATIRAGHESHHAPRVIVAIDELDRIGIGDDARRFINEVKSIFSVDNCYYLVSVSEDVLHDFTLRGMGVRDVFDSAFDEIVRVDYFDYHVARRLLRGQVVGLSEQYLALAYVSSGGLARELLRIARALVKIGMQEGEISLNAVTRRLAEDEVNRSCRASREALTEGDDPQSLSRLIRALDDHPAHVSANVLELYIQDLAKLEFEPSGRAARLQSTMVARVYFLCTVLSVFDDQLSESSTRWADETTQRGASFDALARARRYISTHPELAIELIHDFRELWGIAPLGI